MYFISIYVIFFAFLTCYTQCDDPKSFNFAAHSAGAVIIEKSPTSAKGFHNLLNDDKDKYGICSSKDDKWVVIGLSEDVLITSVTIATYEKYSSVLREFHLLASPVHPTLDWIKLGTFIAEPRLGEQIFNIVNISGAHTRYIRLEITSQYFDEELFTISQIKVHGLSFMASLKQEVELSNQDMLEKWSHLQQEDVDIQSNDSVELTTGVFLDSQYVQKFAAIVNASVHEHENTMENIILEGQDNSHLPNEQVFKGNDIDWGVVNLTLTNANLTNNGFSKAISLIKDSIANMTIQSLNAMNLDHFIRIVKRDEVNEPAANNSIEEHDDVASIMESTVQISKDHPAQSKLMENEVVDNAVFSSEIDTCFAQDAYRAMIFDGFHGFHLEDGLVGEEIVGDTESNQIISNDTDGLLSMSAEKAMLKNISSCMESLRFVDFKAKMLEKLNFSADDNSLHHSSLYKENVFRNLVHRIITLEMHERITEKFMIQVSFHINITGITFFSNFKRP